MTTAPEDTPQRVLGDPRGEVRALVDQLVRAAAPRLAKVAVARIARALTDVVIAVRDELHAAEGDVPAGRLVVNGANAAALPEGSLVIRCTDDGTPMVAGNAVRRTHHGWASRGGTEHPSDPTQVYSLFRVLYRAPEAPTASVKVGDTLTNREQLDALPAGSGVRSNDGMRVRYERLLDGAWYCAGDTRAKSSAQVLGFGGARVLHFGENADPT